MVGQMQPKSQRERAMISESAYVVDQDDAGGRSCLALRFPKKSSGSSGSSSQSGRRYSRNNTSARSSVSSADQSEDTHALLSDQTPQLVWNHTTSRHNPKYRHHESPTSTMDLPSAYSDFPQQLQTHNSVKSLLIPPTPVNRAPQTRQRRPQRGTYDGEVEPEGIRGQEAVVLPNQSRPPRTPGAPQVRTSFEPVTPLAPSRSANIYGYPHASRQTDESSDDHSTPSRSTIDRPNNKLTSVHEEAPMQFSPETGQAVRWTGSQRRPRLQRYIDAESTASDDDIRHMMPDLMPDLADNVAHHWQTPTNKRPTHTLQSTRPLSSNPLTVGVQGAYPSQAAVVSPESPGLSRAAQTAAAAAAAVSHSRIPLPADRSTDLSEMNDIQDNLDKINAVAMEHVHNGDYERALAAFTQVLQIQQRTHGDIHPAVASAHHNLGTVHAKRAALLSEGSRSQRHCRSQALECFQAAARVARDSLGKNHPNVAVSLVRIGFLLLQSRQYGNAVVTFQEALRIRLAYYGPKHGLAANLYNNLGVCHMHMQEFEKGKQQLDQALNIQRRIVKEHTDDPWVHQLELADTLFNIGGLCLEWIRRQGPHPGRTKEAVVAFQETLNIRSKVLGPDDPSVLQVRTLLEMARSIPSPSSSSETMLYSGKVEFESPRVEESLTHEDDYARAPISTNALNGFSSGTTTDASRRSYNPEFSERNNGDYLGGKSQHTSRNVEIGQKVCEDERYSENNNMRQPNDYRTRKSDSTPHYTGVSEMPQTESEADQDYTRHRRIRIEPFFVPETSPVKGRRHNDSNDAIRGPLSEDEHFSIDKSFETQEKKKFGYDDEESFMLRDTGVDSLHGRIHYPRTWQKAGMTHRGFSSSSGHGPDIIVTKPYRRETYHDAPPSSQTNRSVQDRNSDKAQTIHSLDRSPSFDRNSTVSTGNSDRDDVMSRARAILSTYAFTENSHRPQSDSTHNSKGHAISQQDLEGQRDSDLNSHKTGTFDQDLLEDGVAPLGGYWPSRATESGGQIPIKHMLADPTKNLPAIHAEASKLLKSNYALDAWNLFDVVLQCQRNKHGPLHPDVALALHNVGISQLRADSHADALKSFEEAARIRKGSLGSEHPLVAVSLVKVGICLLLMHRFDQALWNFREALTIRKRALGPLHPSTARIYNNIGCVHVEFNEFKEARRAFEAALDVQRNALCHDPDSGSLMFGTATTLCNLGYLYRYRDLHAKACLVLKEAVDLQETVLGKSNATVLSTLDNLADSYANSGNATDALKTYNMILERFRAGGPSDHKKLARAEAVLLYKMSRVHRQQNDRKSQLDCLETAHQALLSVDGSGNGDSLERRIQYDIRACRDMLENSVREWYK